MTYSIYHFFANLIQNKDAFWQVDKLEEFPFDEMMIASRGGSKFPDVSLKVNEGSGNLTGGELIEIKDALSYTVASFNSQIPQQKKELSKLDNKVISEMRQHDPATDALPVRDVYYLVRGRKELNTEIVENKICLVSGKFFETVTVSDLIQEAFKQVIDERHSDIDEDTLDNLKNTLDEVLFEQDDFSKTRQVDNASVSIRFRIMTQAVGAGNILSNNIYSKISINTLNLVLPFYEDNERDVLQHHMRSVMDNDYENLEQFELKHPYNGSFWVFQIPI